MVVIVVKGVGVGAWQTRKRAGCKIRRKKKGERGIVVSSRSCCNHSHKWLNVQTPRSRTTSTCCGSLHRLTFQLLALQRCVCNMNLSINGVPELFSGETNLPRNGFSLWTHSGSRDVITTGWLIVRVPTHRGGTYLFGGTEGAVLMTKIIQNLVPGV